MEVSGQLDAPAALSPGKQPPVPIGEEGGWVPKSAWIFWREKDVLPLSGMEPRLTGCPARSLVTIPNELYGLQFECYTFLKVLVMCIVIFIAAIAQSV
jgi:hypothetical protein